MVEHPLDTDALSRRWREILDDPRFANFAGKIDLDRWGRMIVTPVNTEHAGVAGRLARLLEQQLGRRALVEARAGSGIVVRSGPLDPVRLRQALIARPAEDTHFNRMPYLGEDKMQGCASRPRARLQCRGRISSMRAKSTAHRACPGPDPSHKLWA